jgi:hypothetical protein
MPDATVGQVGEMLLDRPGVVLMVTLWSIGVGCAFLPIRFKEPLRNSLPALGVALLLAFIPPRLFSWFACAMASTVVIMVPCLWLIATDERVNRRRSAFLLGASAVFLALGPLVPEEYGWLLMPFAPLAIFGVPVAVLLLAHRGLRARPWLMTMFGSLAFTAAWLVWRARDVYYRMKLAHDA